MTNSLAITQESIFYSTWNIWRILSSTKLLAKLLRLLTRVWPDKSTRTTWTSNISDNKYALCLLSTSLITLNLQITRTQTWKLWCRGTWIMRKCSFLSHVSKWWWNGKDPWTHYSTQRSFQSSSNREWSHQDLWVRRTLVKARSWIKIKSRTQTLRTSLKRKRNLVSRTSLCKISRTQK